VFFVTTSKIQQISALIGRPVVSVETANELGHVYDLIVHPTRGEMVGLSVQSSEENTLLVSRDDIHSVGLSAVMVKSDQSLCSTEQSPLAEFPLAKNTLIGVSVITEDGKLLGEIANVYFYSDETSAIFIYEVRSSILDKLLGHGLYFPASQGSAFADDASRLVVSSDTENADHKLDAIASRLFSPSGSFAPQVVVRSHN
jgi:uncharacterized protein YrrD